MLEPQALRSDVPGLRLCPLRISGRGGVRSRRGSGSRGGELVNGHGIAAGQKSPSRYVNFGCRCVECVEAWSRQGLGFITAKPCPKCRGRVIAISGKWTRAARS